MKAKKKKKKNIKNKNVKKVEKKEIKEELKDDNYDYFQSIIVPKKTQIDYEKSFGDIYELVQDDKNNNKTKKNTLKIIKEPINVFLENLKTNQEQNPNMNTSKDNYKNKNKNKNKN